LLPFQQRGQKNTAKVVLAAYPRKGAAKIGQVEGAQKIPEKIDILLMGGWHDLVIWRHVSGVGIAVAFRRSS
jgi:hypothetical protein